MKFDIIPKKKYGVILMDPPWDVPFKTPYTTMTITSLALMDIKSLCSKDGCTLFVWTPNSHLEEALGLCRVWGFKYKQLITWCKNYGLGRPPYSATEHCIMASRGSPKRAHQEFKGNELFNWFETKDKPKHSVKPSRMFELIESIDSMRDTPKLEMFARTKRDGWDAWGKELK